MATAVAEYIIKMPTAAAEEEQLWKKFAANIPAWARSSPARPRWLCWSGGPPNWMRRAPRSEVSNFTVGLNDKEAFHEGIRRAANTGSVYIYWELSSDAWGCADVWCTSEDYYVSQTLSTGEKVRMSSW
jgi:hypothetical protein